MNEFQEIYQAPDLPAEVMKAYFARRVSEEANARKRARVAAYGGAILGGLALGAYKGHTVAQGVPFSDVGFVALPLVSAVLTGSVEYYHSTPGGNWFGMPDTAALAGGFIGGSVAGLAEILGFGISYGLTKLL